MSTILTRSHRVRAWLTMIGIGILLVCLAWGLIVFIWSVAAGTGTARPASGAQLAHRDDHCARESCPGR